MPLRRITRSPAPAATDEEERPARSRTRTATEEDAPRRSLRARGGDDEETRPRSRANGNGKSSRAVGDDGVVGAGWGGYKRVKESMPSDFLEQFKITAEKTVIKFLEDEPFGVYKQHWCDWMPKGSKLSYTCPGEDCPICDETGDKPNFKSCFNIVEFTDPEHPQNKVLAVGMTVGDIIFEEAQEASLTRKDRYFVINMTGNKKGRKQTNLIPIKARDLGEDYGFEPLTEEELEVFEKKLFTQEEIPVTDRQTLQKVAEAANE